MTRHLAVWIIALVACLAIGEARAQSLVPDSNSVDISADAGSTTAHTNTVDVTTSSGTLQFSATASTTSGGSWLTVCLTPTCPANSFSVATDTDNGQLTIQAAPPSPGLQVGTYNGTVTLQCVAPSVCLAVTINVTLHVTGVVLTATPNQINVNVGQGQTTTTNVTLGGNTNLGITVLSGGAWLSAPANVNGPATLMLTLNAAGLPAGGPYLGSVSLQCISGSPCLSVTISVALTVTPPALMAVPTVPLSGFGRGTPVSATVFVSSSSGGALNFTSTPSTTSGGSWLSVSLSPTTTPQTLTIQANPANLDVGSYTGTVTLACTSSTPCTGTSITVNLTIQPGITVSSPALTLTATHSFQSIGANLTITSLVTGGLPVTSVCTTTDGAAGWLGCNLNGTATTAGTAFPVFAASGEMLGNTSYHGTLAITGGGTTINVPVTFRLQGTQLTVSPSILNFAVTAGQISAPQSVAVGPAGFTASPMLLDPRVAISPTGPFSTGTSIQVSFDTRNPLNGTTNANFTGEIQCTVDNCFDVPLTVHATVTIPPPATLSVTPSTLSTFSVVQGNVSASQSVGVTSSDGSSLPFTVSGPAWVRFGASSGTATGTGLPVTISVDAHSLPLGQTSGTVTFACNPTFNPITDQTTPNCPSILLPITANVTAPPTLRLSPSALNNFSVVQGTVSASQSVSVTSSDGSSLSFAVTAPAWVTLGAASGTATGAASPVSISVDAHSLPLGQTFGTVTFACSGGSSCPSVPLQITANVTSSASLTANPSALTFTAYTARSANSKSVTVTTSDGSALAFTVSGVPSWLTVSPLGGTTGQPSGTLSLTLNPNPPTASASGSVTLTPSGSSSAPVVVPVNLTVSPFTISANPSPLPISVASGQSQTASLGITTIDGAPAQINVTASGSPIFPTLSSASVTAPGNINVTANAGGVPAGSYNATVTLACDAANPCASVQVPVQITVTNGPQAPVITPNGIVPIYSTSTTIQPGSWVSIYGSNFVSSPVTWMGDFPTSLGGITVTINNKPAYIYFVSPGQIDVQAPDDTQTGSVTVVVANGTGATTQSTVTLGAVGPSLCVVGSTTHYVAGTVTRSDGSGTQGGGTYDFIGPNGASLGYPTRPIKAGDIVTLWGVGFGPVSPPIAAGQVVPANTHGTATSDIEFQIGGITVKPSFAGITEAGLFQFNLTIPGGVGSGDVPITAMVGGFRRRQAL